MRWKRYGRLREVLLPKLTSGSFASGLPPISRRASFWPSENLRRLSAKPFMALSYRLRNRKRGEVAAPLSKKETTMRNLVPPMASVHCELCGGELLLKRVEPDNPVLEMDTQTYLCAKCGHEQSRRVIHDPYTAHIPRRSPGLR